MTLFATILFLTSLDKVKGGKNYIGFASDRTKCGKSWIDRKVKYMKKNKLVKSTLVGVTAITGVTSSIVKVFANEGQVSFELRHI